MATQPNQTPAHHVHGQMDYRAQQGTFNGFVRFMTWAVGLIFVVLLFLLLANS